MPRPPRVGVRAPARVRVHRGVAVERGARARVHAIAPSGWLPQLLGPAPREHRAQRAVGARGQPVGLRGDDEVHVERPAVLAEPRAREGEELPREEVRRRRRPVGVRIEHDRVERRGVAQQVRPAVHRRVAPAPGGGREERLRHRGEARVHVDEHDLGRVLGPPAPEGESSRADHQHPGRAPLQGRVRVHPVLDPLDVGMAGPGAVLAARVLAVDPQASDAVRVRLDRVVRVRGGEDVGVAFEGEVRAAHTCDHHARGPEPPSDPRPRRERGEHEEPRHERHRAGDAHVLHHHERGREPARDVAQRARGERGAGLAGRGLRARARDQQHHGLREQVGHRADPEHRVHRDLGEGRERARRLERERHPEARQPERRPRGGRREVPRHPLPGIAFEGAARPVAEREGGEERGDDDARHRDRLPGHRHERAKCDHLDGERAVPLDEQQRGRRARADGALSAGHRRVPWRRTTRPARRPRRGEGPRSWRTSRGPPRPPRTPVRARRAPSPVPRRAPAAAGCHRAHPLPPIWCCKAPYAGVRCSRRPSPGRPGVGRDRKRPIRSYTYKRRTIRGRSGQAGKPLSFNVLTPSRHGSAHQFALTGASVRTQFRAVIHRGRISSHSLPEELSTGAYHFALTPGRVIHRRAAHFPRPRRRGAGRSSAIPSRSTGGREHASTSRSPSRRTRKSR